VHARNGSVCGPLHCFTPPGAYAMASSHGRFVRGGRRRARVACHSVSLGLFALVSERRRTMQNLYACSGRMCTRSSGLTCTCGPDQKGACRTETYHCRKGNGRIYSSVNQFQKLIHYLPNCSERHLPTPWLFPCTMTCHSEIPWQSL